MEYQRIVQKILRGGEAAAPRTVPLQDGATASVADPAASDAMQDSSWTAATNIDLDGCPPSYIQLTDCHYFGLIASGVPMCHVCARVARFEGCSSGSSNLSDRLTASAERRRFAGGRVLTSSIPAENIGEGSASGEGGSSNHTTDALPQLAQLSRPQNPLAPPAVAAAAAAAAPAAAADAAADDDTGGGRLEQSAVLIKR